MMEKPYDDYSVVSNGEFACRLDDTQGFKEIGIDLRKATFSEMREYFKNLGFKDDVGHPLHMNWPFLAVLERACLTTYCKKRGEVMADTYGIIPDNELQMLWRCPECTDEQDEYIESVVTPDFYQENGTPMCQCGEDMEYIHTERVRPQS